MITQEFLTLLLETLAATIPAGAHPGDAGREASLAMACTMLEALHPADAKEAAAAARAIAAHFAAMDGFARAARPGIADDTAVRLRNNALAAARLADAVTRPRRQAPLPEVEKQSRSSAPAANVGMPASRVRHRAELPATIPGLPDVATTQPMRRAGLHSETALSPVQPTVSVPG
jgi:hypothetical protein